MSWSLIIKAFLALLPIIMQAVREGRIKNGDKNEVLKELAAEHKRYVDAAAAARDRIVPDDYKDRNPNQRD